MWLLPVFSFVSRTALRLFYRLTLAGERVPEGGPVLLVANHPNSLLDPAMVVAAARRPVRFLAKAPLFTDRQVGWLVRGAGAIPVYRRQDDPAAMGQNDDTFRAVWDALAKESAAVGIFPEGTSHSEPSLVPLKTGAARIALGAARQIGGAFPVVPVGLSFREKGTFRSEALSVVGDAVAWDDLAARGPEDWDAVETLTDRIAEALQAVTVNLERWEDAPLVEAAEAIYAAELPVDPDPADRVARLREAAEGLARLRAEERGEWNAVAREVKSHARVLKVLGIRPDELRAPRLGTVAEWMARQLFFFGLGAPIAALGIALYYLPYRLTGVLEARAKPSADVRGTFKLLFGAALHIVWTIVLIAVAGWLGEWAGAGAALLGLPLVGYVTLHVAERWRRAVGEARRFFLRARRRREMEELRARQRALAERLHALWEEVRA